jgi:sodium/potassium-transporting ATPase subunit alpha
VIEFFAGLFTYLVILGQNGFYLQDLIGIQAQWDSPVVGDLVDSYGQEWVRKSMHFWKSMHLLHLK